MFDLPVPPGLDQDQIRPKPSFKMVKNRPNMDYILFKLGVNHV